MLHTKKTSIALLLALSSLCISAQNLPSTSTPSKSDPKYNFYLNGDTLQQALSSFANNNGLQIYFSSDLNAKLLATQIRGHFTGDSNLDFLNSLATQYGFQWFSYSGTLYICSLRQFSRNIEADPDNMGDIKAYLSQTGILDQRFTYSELRAQNKILISGPREYVNAVAKQIQSLKVQPRNQQVGIFRLKYASATDVKLTFNNQQLIIPGVATLLQNLFATNLGGSKGKINDDTNVILPNGQNSLNFPSKTSTDNINMNSNTTSFSSNLAPNIQADNRMNTIIIRDSSNNLKLYKNTISQLDVPSPLIQVEVMIVRVDQNKLNQAGVNWWGSGINKSGVGFNPSQATSSNGGISYAYGQVNPGQLIVGSLASFSANLLFLENKKIAKTEEKPSLATIDNLPALLSINEMLGGTTTANNSSTQSNSNNLGNQLTHSLEITPHVIFDSDNKPQIKLTMILQDGYTNSLDNNAVAPTYTQSYLSSQAVINDNQSIMLAGYTKNQLIDDSSKVPFLGSIPLLGWFFSNTNHVEHKFTTIYIVTPKIIWLNKVSSSTEWRKNIFSGKRNNLN